MPIYSTLVNPLTDYLIPQFYGAKADNVTDDTAALQAALNACPVDGTVYLAAGRYRTTAPLLLPPGVTLLGQKTRRPRNSFGGSANLTDQAYISPRATFAGTAVLKVLDAQSGGWATMAQGSAIKGIMINGAALPAGPIDGILAFGQIQGLVLDDVSVIGTPGIGFNFAQNAAVVAGPKNPFSLRARGCFVTGNGTAASTGGYFLYNCTDSTFTDCEVIGVTGDGWTAQGGGNTHLIGCRGENNTGNGFTVGQTSGLTNATLNMVGCSTNLNAGNGFDITAVNHVSLSGCVSSGENAGFVGFNLHSATGVITLNNCTSPSGATSDYGLKATGNLNAAVTGGAFYGTTGGYLDGGTNTRMYFSPSTALLTGTAATPTVTPEADWSKPPTASYFYTSSPFAATTSATLANGTLRVTPWLITRACTLTALGAEVTVIGDVGSLLRLGIYADNGSYYPGALVLDAGTIAGDSATVQAITGLTTALTPGIYWVGGVVQAVTVTQPTVRTQGTWTPPCPIGTGAALPGAGNTVTGYSMTGVVGALGAFSGTVLPVGAVPRTFAKVTVL
jgi:hypothetical protein